MRPINPMVLSGGAGVVSNLSARRAAVDNKWVSSAVSNTLILRHLTIAFSTECQNHANLFSLFRCHVRGEKNIAEIFENFSVSTETCAVGSTEAIRPQFNLRFLFAGDALHRSGNLNACPMLQTVETYYLLCVPFTNSLLSSGTMHFRYEICKSRQHTYIACLLVHTITDFPDCFPLTSNVCTVK
jgi:hypothetical protein